MLEMKSVFVSADETCLLIYICAVGLPRGKCLIPASLGTLFDVYSWIMLLQKNMCSYSTETSYLRNKIRMIKPRLRIGKM